MDSCEPAVGSRGLSPAGTLCGHLVRADRAWWAHELVQRCPGARAGGQLRVEGPHFLPTQRAAPSFPSLLIRAPPRCWTQAGPRPFHPGLVSPLPWGETRWLVLKGRRSQRGRGPGGLPGGGGLHRTGRLKRLKATLLQKYPPRVRRPRLPCGAELARPCGLPALSSRSAALVGAAARPVASGPGLHPGVEAASLSLSPAPPTLGHPSAIWLPWILAATRAGSLSPWTVPEHGGGRALRVTGTDPPGSPALHRLPACTSGLTPAPCCSFIGAGLRPIGHALRPP